MLLVIDIGNTNICLGCFRGPELICELRLKTDIGRTVDEYAALLNSLFTQRLGKEFTFQRCVISSVVPPITAEISNLVESSWKVKALIVGPGTKTGVPIRVHEPTAVGADRIVNAVAAKNLYGAPALVVDFGTATSFDYVSKEGFEGGIIAPGVNTSLDALVSNTAKLPRIELVWPKSVLGKTTVQCMQSGAVLGYLCLVDGLIDSLIAENGPIEYVIATGGLGRLFASHSRRIKQYDPHLTLSGMRIISELNQ